MYIAITLNDYVKGDLMEGLVFENIDEILEHSKSVIYFLMRNYKLPDDVVEHIEHLDSVNATFDEYVGALREVLDSKKDDILIIPIPPAVRFIKGERHYV